MKPKAELKIRSWMKSMNLLTTLTGVLLLALAAANGRAQTYFVLRNFSNSEGYNPEMGVVLSGTTLFGTTYWGYPGFGSVFKVNTDGTGFTVLKHFGSGDGSYPGNLVLSGTMLYGATLGGGISDDGVVFKLNTDGGGYTVLKQFTNNSVANISVLSGTTLYGTTGAGGVSNGGTIFKLNTDGSGFTVLKQFTNSSGGANLILSDTTLYGAAGSGVFKVNTDGSSYTVLKQFTNTIDGSEPHGGLVLSGTTLYGTTGYGGVSDSGTIFKLNTDGSGFAVLKQFTNSSDGRLPLGNMILSGMTLYGTTAYGGVSNSGTVFKLNTDGSGYTVVKQFTNTSEGLFPSGGALVLSDTTLYGTTHYGGSFNRGVLFGLALPTTAPKIFTPPQSQSVEKDSTVAFGVGASGIPPLVYQWFLSGNPITSTTTNSGLVLNNVQVPQSGAYTVVVTNLFGSVTSSPATLDVIAPGDTTVRNCTEQALRLALAMGNSVSFACDGTITLGSTITITTNNLLHGSGHQITISGGGLVRVFAANSNAFLTLNDLTIANGRSDSGAGIFNNGGKVTATNCHFVANCAQGAVGAEGSPGQNGYGGAVYNSGVLNANNCAFVWNSVVGGTGGLGAPDQYGPLHTGGVGGVGDGGAICNFGALTMAGCTLSSNSAFGGVGGAGGTPGQISWWGGDGGPGGAGGHGHGGALFNGGSAYLVNNTFAPNSGAGGQGGGGGNGGPPGNPDYHAGNGANGGAGGSGYSAIYDVNGQCHLTNCTLALNWATAGIGGAGGAGWSGTRSSGPNGTAVGGGIGTSGGLLVNTLLSGNAPSNCSGTISDAGHNLSSDASCGFTSLDSMNNTDPKLGPLADNGGPTLTMALLPGSPAIDAGDKALAPPTDQRGAPRPAGLACDIGAYEYDPLSLAMPPPTQTAEAGAVVNFAALVTGFPPPTYQWFFNGNALTGCTNSVLWLSGIQASNVGAYTVVVSGAGGSVTSAPAMLNVIAAVERRPVPGVKVTGEVGSLLNVEYASSLSPSSNWTTLGSVSLTSTSQFCPDLTMPLPPERFYRAWQTGTPGVVPSLNLNFVPAIMLTGKVGDSLHLDCINAIGPTNAWVTLATVTLTNTSQLYFDVSAPGQPARLYRIVPVP